MNIVHFFSNNSGSTLIHLAARHGNLSTLKLLLEYTDPKAPGRIHIMDASVPEYIDIVDNQKVTPAYYVWYGG